MYRGKSFKCENYFQWMNVLSRGWGRYLFCDLKNKTSFQPKGRSRQQWPRYLRCGLDLQWETTNNRKEASIHPAECGDFTLGPEGQCRPHVASSAAIGAWIEVDSIWVKITAFRPWWWSMGRSLHMWRNRSQPPDLAGGAWEGLHTCHSIQPISKRCLPAPSARGFKIHTTKDPKKMLASSLSLTELEQSGTKLMIMYSMNVEKMYVNLENCLWYN